MVHDKRHRLDPADPLDRTAQRKADQDEDERFEHEHHDEPARIGAEADVGGQDLVLVPAHRETRGDGRDDARHMHGFAGDIGGPAQEDRDQHDEHAVLQALGEENPACGDQRADDHPADRDEGEALHGFAGMEHAAERRGDGEAEEDQARRVVEQALAFEQRFEPARQMNALQHRARRHRVGRRYDRAQCEAGGPGQVGQDHVHDHADDERREHHRADSQRQDAGKVAAKAAERGEIGAVHQQRRQEEHEREFGIERDLGQAGDEGECAAADEERGRGRPAQLQRQPVESDDEREQSEDELEGYRRRASDQVRSMPRSNDEVILRPLVSVQSHIPSNLTRPFVAAFAAAINAGDCACSKAGRDPRRPAGLRLGGDSGRHAR